MRLIGIPLLTLVLVTPSLAAPRKSTKKKTPVTSPAAESSTTEPVAAAAPEAPKDPRCEVAVSIDNLRKSGDQYRGQICYTVFKGKDGFPDKPHLAFTNQCVPVQQSASLTFTVKELPCNQDYGVALLHDENMNRQLDKNLAIPKEGIGMSNNPSFIRVNSPPYDEVKFMVQEPHSSQKIRMHYF